MEVMSETVPQGDGRLLQRGDTMGDGLCLKRSAATDCSAPVANCKS